jgi:hypothetical protein
MHSEYAYVIYGTVTKCTVNMRIVKLFGNGEGLSINLFVITRNLKVLV